MSHTPGIQPARVALRALVVGVDQDDPGLPGWLAVLDQLHLPYEVVRVRTDRLPPLTCPDGSGCFNAVLLTSPTLGWAGPDGWAGPPRQFWQSLWDYERRYGVRQVALQAGWSTQPEDYGLRGLSEGPVGEEGVLARVTAAGREVFDLLAPGAQIPIRQAYLYRCTGLVPGTEPLLTAGDLVLAVRSFSADGRERAALTFTCNEHLLHTHLLGHGLLRWACRGVHLGVRRHVLKVDVDDYFGAGDVLTQDGPVSRGGFLLSDRDVSSAAARQAQLRSEHPVAADFRLTMAYNGCGAQVHAGRPGYAGFLAATAATREVFEWLNHTWTHRNLTDVDPGTALTEIVQNLTAARELDLAVDERVLKTGEYSGLGLHSADPTDALAQVHDLGLGRSNPALLDACTRAGVQVLHGNMSFAGHRPAAVNGSLTHPLSRDVLVVADWPSSLAYFCATPQHQVAFHTEVFGPGGRLAYWQQAPDYEQYLAFEVEQTLTRVVSGSVHAHTVHIPNLHDYGDGRSLVFDWVAAVVARYAQILRTPLLCPPWARLAAMTQEHNRHHEGVGVVEAVHDRAAGTVTFTATRPVQVLATGVHLPGRPADVSDARCPSPRHGVVRVSPGSPLTVPVQQHPLRPSPPT